MAYGELYRLEYYDHLLPGRTGRKTTVKILRKDYVGSWSYIDGAGDPVRLSGKTDDDNLFSPLVATSCELFVISKTSFQFLDLFSADFRQHKVEIYKEPTPGATQILWWTGYVLPDNYLEPLHWFENYEVRILATDGIGSLKNIDFLQTNGTYFEGKSDIFGLINSILYKTGLILPSYYALSFDEIYTDTLFVDIDGPIEWNNVFAKIYLDFETFYVNGVPKCDYVLKQILQAFGARLIQSKGYWVITEVTKNINEHLRYDSGFGTSTYNPVKIYTGKDDVTNNRLFFKDKDGDLQINPAYKEFTIHHDFLKRESIIKNYSFEKWNVVSPPSGLPSDFGDYSFTNWNKNPSNGRFVKPAFNPDGKTYYMMMSGQYSAINLGQYIQSEPLEIHLNNRSALFGLSIRKYFFHTKLEIKIGTKWLNNNGDLQNSVYQFDIDPVSESEFYKFEQEINPVDYTGNLVIKIYRPYSTAIPNDNRPRYFHIDEVIFRFTDLDSAAKDITYDININQNNNYIPDKIESILGDVPNIIDREDIYLGTFWRYDPVNSVYIPTLLWSKNGQGYATILQQLADLIAENNRVPKQFLTGLKLCGNFDFDSCLEIPFLENRRYIPIHWDCSDKFCEWNIDCIEILGDRLLVSNESDYIVTNNGDYIKV